MAATSRTVKITKDEEVVILNAMFEQLARIDNDLIDGLRHDDDLTDLLQARRDVAHIVAKLGGHVPSVQTVIG